MYQYDSALSLTQLLLPTICSGILLSGFFLLIYMYRKSGLRLYVTASILCLSAFITSTSEMLVILYDAWFDHHLLALHFARIQYISLTSFVLGFPFLLRYLLDGFPLWHIINKIIMTGSFCFACFYTVGIFIYPEWISSPNIVNEIFPHQADVSPIVLVRDVVFLGVMSYTILSFLLDIIIHKKFIFLCGLLLGIGCFYAGLLLDILHSHTYRYYDFWPTIIFSRSIPGMTIFAIMCMEKFTRNFVDQSNLANLSYIAFHDPLTGFFNRRAFNERFRDTILQASRKEKENLKALLFIDLDNFKNINDSLGHHMGDRLLKQVAARFYETLRRSDYVFRIGGDEFSCVLNNITDDLDAANVASKIIKKISEPIRLGDHEIVISVSIGITLYPKDGLDSETLVKNVDIALQEAKKKRSSYSFFDKKMNKLALDRMKMDNYLRVAVEKNEFQLYYQPIVDNKGHIIGMESLIRWNHPQLGYVLPDTFIKAAELNGYIIAIGEWVMRNACSQLKKWHEEGFDDLSVAVNVSPCQFRQENFTKKVAHILEETGLDPGFLEIEITESSMMENPEEAILKMQKLCQLGVSFSIDDFGTGYSSLSCIKRFPIKHLKIDKCFIDGLENEANDNELTRAIISMAHSLRLKVTAEGVESEKQKIVLNTWNCDTMQGFLFGKPLPPDKFIVFLREARGK